MAPVLAISSVLRHEVTPVGVIFAVIPVVVVTVVAIVNSDLHAGFLRPRSGHDGDWGDKDSSQEY